MPEGHDSHAQSPDHFCGFAALIGRPNAGKSTLLNALVGQKIAIVTPKPQTTRNQISGVITLEHGQIILLDTPGVHERRGKMNQALLRAAWQALAGADVAVAIVDGAKAASRPASLEKELRPLVAPLRDSGLPVLVALNKVDAVKDKAALLPVMQRVSELWPGAEVFPISALRGQGLDELLQAMASRLPARPQMFPEDQISTVPLRFMAAEIVREKLFLRLREELPYSTAVEIDSWDEDPERGVTHIQATIFVARSTHKSMVIGKKGQMLKTIGTESRAEIEQLTEGKVFLELWVKVREGWTEDVNFLRAIGLA